VEGQKLCEPCVTVLTMLVEVLARGTPALMLDVVYCSVVEEWETASRKADKSVNQMANLEPLRESFQHLSRGLSQCVGASLFHSHSSRKRLA